MCLTFGVLFLGTKAALCVQCEKDSKMAYIKTFEAFVSILQCKHVTLSWIIFYERLGEYLTNCTRLEKRLDLSLIHNPSRTELLQIPKNTVGNMDDARRAVEIINRPTTRLGKSQGKVTVVWEAWFWQGKHPNIKHVLGSPWHSQSKDWDSMIIKKISMINSTVHNSIVLFRVLCSLTD